MPSETEAAGSGWSACDRPDGRDPGSAPVGRELSHAQERFWLREQAFPGDQAQRILQAVAVDGAVDTEAFALAVEAVIVRLSGQSPETTLAGAVDPPVHAEIVCVEPARRVVVFTAHRCLIDRVSPMLVLEEALAACGPARAAPPGVLPLADDAGFARWQRREADWLSRRTQRAGALAGMPLTLDLPIDRVRPPVRTYRHGTRSVPLSADVASRVSAAAARRGVDIEVICLAAAAGLVHRITGADDFAIGLPASYRSDPRFARAIGQFENWTVMRCIAGGAPDATAWTARIAGALDEARAVADLPFELLVETLGAGRSLAHAPVFQVAFLFGTAAARTKTVGSFGLQCLAPVHDSPDCDVAFGVTWDAHAPALELEYDESLFTEEAAARMLGWYEVALEHFAREDGVAVSRLALLSAAERETIVSAWNATREPYPEDTNLVALFERQVRATPDAIAVSDGGRDVTYAELSAESNRLARWLAGAGVGIETLVGVCLERSAAVYAVVLGILKAGGCYVPLDPGYPAERLRLMVADAKLPLVVTAERWRHLVPDAGARVLCLDVEASAIAAHGAGPVDPGTHAGNLAYAVFTSGSTGRPKGVAVEQRQLLNRFAWMWRHYPFRPGDVSGTKTALNFVDSLWELLGPLLAGVRSVVIPDAVVRDPDAFVDALAAGRVTRMMLVPSLMQIMLDAHDDLAQRLPLLREWCVGGEALTADLARRFARQMPGRLLLDLYGISETFDACCHDASHTGPDDRLVPIGRPIANVRAYVVDDALEPLPPGLAGELCIAGAGVARGYLGNPALTNEKFVPDPFGDGAGGRLYRTGDLARYRPDGVIEYLGRKDGQIKIRGFRVEPDEVTAVLKTHPDVADAVVVARRDHGAEVVLVAYYIARDGAEPSREALRTHLRATLPEYMIPVACVGLERFPMTPSGKLDRLALPPPPPAAGDGRGFEAPQAGLEAEIATAWREVLGVPSVGRHDSFFDIGGTSIGVVQVVARLRRSVRPDIPIVAMYQFPTVQGLARHLSDGTEDPAGMREARERAAQRRLARARRAGPATAGGER